MEIFIPVGLLLAGVVVVAICAWIFAKLKLAAALDRATADMQAELARVAERLKSSEETGQNWKAQFEAVNIERSKLRVELLDEATRRAALEAEKRKEEEHRVENRTLLSDHFKNLASDILEDKSKRFTELNRLNLENTLAPLQDRLKEFGEKVEKSYANESDQRSLLKGEIRTLCELNERMRADAVNLTNALKGQTKTQGNWGEMILERVLQMAGLVKGREYHVQASMQNVDGKRFQPDIVINLPDDKHLVVDSKVTLVSYERFCSLDDTAMREEELQRHAAALRRHVEDLSSKNYQGLYQLNSVDFVLMFVPIEAALTLALQHDAGIYEQAFSRNVVVVSPTTLLATMRTIAHIWRQESQIQNVKEVFRQAGDLYDKFVGFVKDVEELGGRLKLAQNSYDSAFNKLSSGRGNLVGRAEKLKQMGAKTGKQLPRHLIDDGENDATVLELNGTVSVADV
jgi:DNA recombination protein RmuC